MKYAFGDEILEINSHIILTTYYAKEESIYIMLVIDIKKLKIINCISHSLEYGHYVEKYKVLKNPKFYLYQNQIEYLALNYPIFIKNNYFIKNDIQIKNFEDKINYVYLLNNDKLVYTTNKGLII